MACPRGEAKREPLRVNFEPRLKAAAQAPPRPAQPAAATEEAAQESAVANQSIRVNVDPLFVMTAFQNTLDVLWSCTRSVHREFDKQLKSLWLYMAVHDNGHRLKSDDRF